MINEKYIKITNHDNKTWILPANDLKIALNLYQPSSCKGILLKKYLPMCIKNPLLGGIVKKVLRIQTCDLEIPKAVLESIRNVFQQDEITFAYFLGTPSVHQKGTIQIAAKDEILGYAKYSGANNIKSLFLKEKAILELLSECEIRNIPKCLRCEEIPNGTTVFIQNTKKTLESKIVHELGEPHFDFLCKLAKNTQIECDYSGTDYYQILQEFKSNLVELDELGFESSVLLSCIEKVENSLVFENTFSVYHGDFTPWNTFVMETGELYAFDFEYAKRTFPKYLDAFHFYTQTLLFKKNKHAKEIMELFQKEFLPGKFGELFKNPYISYLQYLVSIMAFYIKRDKGVLEQENRQNLKTWYKLIEMILRII